MGVSERLRAAAAGLLLVLVCTCAPQVNGAEPPEPKAKPAAPAAPAKAPPAPAAPAAPKISAEDLAQAEEAAKLLPDPAPAAGLETAAGWALADWEDPGQLQKLDLPKAAVKALLYLATAGGKKGKSLLTLTRDLALPEKGAARIAVYNPGPEAAQVALAFWVTAGWVYYESAPQRVAAGAWKILEFDLAAANFKTEKTKWQHTAKLLRREATKRIGVLLMGIPAGKPAAVYICGLSAEAPAAAPPADGPGGAQARLAQRVEKLRALLEDMKQAAQDSSYFWPAGRETRLRELMDRREYDAANSLMNEALRDFEHGAAKEPGETKEPEGKK